jgi:hypothetical protein
VRLPPICLERANELLEVSATPVLEAFANEGFLFGLFRIRQGLGCSHDEHADDLESIVSGPVSIASCAAARSASTSSAVSSWPGSRAVAAISFARWHRHQRED